MESSLLFSLLSNNKTVPVPKVIKFLDYKKKVFFLEYYITVYHSIPDTFLAKGNEDAYYVSSTMVFLDKLTLLAFNFIIII